MSSTLLTFGNVKCDISGESAKKDAMCAVPACNSKYEMFKSALAATKSNPSSARNNSFIEGCPADKDELGRGSWELIHAMASAYPDEPTTEEQERARSFITSLAYLYPCPHCAEDFQLEITKSPPRVQSRAALSMWCCEQHNIVNKKLGKKEISCSIALLDERYKTGRPNCWDKSESVTESSK
jgi:mitochondrial FAD-linked sulfhydryl oxidase